MVLPLLLTLAVAAPPTRAAQTLAEATALRDKRRLAEAYEAAQRALKFGDAVEKETWSIHALLAELAAAMDYTDAATDEFARTLELNPAYQLSALASPKLIQPLRKAQALLAGATLTPAVATHATPDGGWLTEITVAGDPNHLVRGGRLLVVAAGPAGDRALAEAGTLQASWACELVRCEYDVILVDEFGNELWRAGSLQAPLVVFRATPPGGVAPIAAASPSAAPAVPPQALATSSEPPPPERPFFRRPLPWAIAAGVLAAVGAILTWQVARDAGALNAALATPSAHLYRDVQALDSAAQAKRAAMFGCYAGAAALAGVMAFQF